MKKLYWILPLGLTFYFTVTCQDREAMAELEEFRAEADVLNIMQQLGMELKPKEE